MGEQVTATDVGNRVVSDDHMIGKVVDYVDATGYIEPAPNLLDSIRSKLGWGVHRDETLPLQRELVEERPDVLD